MEKKIKAFDGRFGSVFPLVVVAVAVMGVGPCQTTLERWFSTNPAPDVAGNWDVDYDDTMDIEVDIGGSVYSGTITGDSGSISFMHDGNPVTLDLDCSWPWVVCPSELFPATVELEQRQFQERPHQVHMEVNTTECVGSPRMPDEGAGECDSSDPQRPCDVEICDAVVEASSTTVGTISDPGDTLQRHPDFELDLLLGVDFAMPTANCVLAGVSWAECDIQYTGDYDVDATEPTMVATELTNGTISTIYGGACLWFESTEYTGDLRAALLGATVTFTTGFTAVKQ